MIYRLGNAHKAFSFEEALYYFGNINNKDTMLNTKNTSFAYREGNLDKLFHKHDNPRRSSSMAILSLHQEVNDITILLNKEQSIDTTLERIEAIVVWLRQQQNKD